MGRLEAASAPTFAGEPSNGSVQASCQLTSESASGSRRVCEPRPLSLPGRAGVASAKFGDDLGRCQAALGREDQEVEDKVGDL